MINRKTNKFESRKLTLEERISRLERALAPTRKSRKFERSNEQVAFTADETRRFKNILKRRNDISVIKCYADPNDKDWYVVLSDDDGHDSTSYGIYKYADGHIEAWRSDRARYATAFDSVDECAENIMHYDPSLYGDNEDWY